MERLTTKSESGNCGLNLPVYDKCIPSKVMGKIQIAINRLAAYEDTGLTPEEIMALIPTKNEPLTLDELREMDEEPVWLHTFSPIQKKTNIAQWAILESVSSSKAVFLRAGVNSRLTKWFCNYGTRWLAYRRKPEDVR